jgi:anti-sigma B factor antagonist
MATQTLTKPFRGLFMTTSKECKPVGRLDGANAATYEKEFLGLLVGDVTSLNIDLSGLDYVSSAGLRVLLVAAKAAKGKGGKVVLSSPKPAILEVLKISGFDKILEVRA